VDTAIAIRTLDEGTYVFLFVHGAFGTRLQDGIGLRPSHEARSTRASHLDARYDSQALVGLPGRSRWVGKT